MPLLSTMICSCHDEIVCSIKEDRDVNRSFPLTSPVVRLCLVNDVFIPHEMTNKKSISPELHTVVAVGATRYNDKAIAQANLASAWPWNN